MKCSNVYSCKRQYALDNVENTQKVKKNIYQRSENGRRPLHFAAENERTLTNTIFIHKMPLRTARTAPYRALIVKNVEILKRPVRN